MYLLHTSRTPVSKDMCLSVCQLVIPRTTAVMCTYIHVYSVLMCVYLYMCIYVYIFTLVCMYIYTWCVYLYMCIYVYIFIFVCMYIYTCVFRADMCIFVHVYVSVYIYIHMYVYIHMCIYTCVLYADVYIATTCKGRTSDSKHTFICMYIYTCVHIYTHVYSVLTHVHIYTRIIYTCVYQVKAGRAIPNIHGIIVAKANEAIILDAEHAHRAAQVEEEAKRMQRKALADWKMLANQLFTRRAVCVCMSVCVREREKVRERESERRALYLQGGHSRAPTLSPNSNLTPKTPTATPKILISSLLPNRSIPNPYLNLESHTRNTLGR